MPRYLRRTLVVSRAFQLQLDWKSLLLTAVMLPILVSLGFWQLDRADQKRELLRQFEVRQQLAPEQVVSLNSYDNYRPVIAIGHSIGGTVSAIAARHRPDLFRALIMIDPATAPGKHLSRLPLPILQALMSRHPLVTGTLKRRRSWPSRETFINSLAKKSVYRSFSPAALNDYAQYGLLQTDGSYTLRYPPEWEAHNFQTTNIPWPSLKHITVPTLVLRGELSYLHPEAQFEHFAKSFSPAVHHQRIDGAGHMAIQEDLPQVLSLCRQWLTQKQLLNWP